MSNTRTHGQQTSRQSTIRQSTISQSTIIGIPGGSHADRPVTFIDHEGTPAVAKRYAAAGAEDIYSAMGDLWASDFGSGRAMPAMPQPLAFRPERNEIIMRRVDGDPLAIRGGLGRSIELGGAVARLLADLHRSGVTVARQRGPAGLIRSTRRKAASLALEAHHGSAVAALAGGLVHVLSDAIPAAGPLVISHGDFSPRNILVSDGGPVLIDFDRMQMAEPARDLCYWAAWIWVTQLMAGQVASWQPGEQFAADYFDSWPGASRPTRASWRFHRAVALVRIAHGWTALRARPDLAAEVLAQGLRQLTE